MTWACWKVERGQPGHTSSQAGSRRERLGWAANHHLNHIGESIVGDTGSLARDVKVFTTKERYELGNNISSKVLAFAFSLSAEIERSMISSRTKEALAR